MLTIGRVAKAAGVNVETVRYYQRRGLLREPDKPLNGQRRYSEDDVNRLSFIRRPALHVLPKESSGLGQCLEFSTR